MNGTTGSARSAKDVIDDAIKENLAAAWLLYTFAILFVVVGLCVLIHGAIAGNTVSSILGGVSSLLFWPSMAAARRTRKENIAIRLLEAPLSRADTAKDASEMLHKLVREIMDDKGKEIK